MNLLQWFSKGATFSTYVENMTVNQEGLLHIYKHVSFPEETISLLQAQTKNLRVIALTADWCGDALLCVPIVQRMCEQANFELRLLIRDENLELMDQYLTNGTARAIPIFIFVDEEGEEQFVWGPRSEEVQRMITTLRATLPAKDDPTFEQQQQNMYATFRQQLASDETLWQSVFSSIAKRLQK